MTTDIVPVIEKLLYSQDTVVIPGLGAFCSNPAPSQANAASGVVSPPSRNLVFDETITADDGLLRSAIAEVLQLQPSAANEALAHFVATTQELLSKREIVSLPRIGRLYKNYVQQIQFLPDSTNFNSEAYGLPSLPYTPISRAREVSTAPPVTTESTSTSAPTKPVAEPAPYVYEPPKDSGRFLPLIGVGILLVLFVAGFLWLRPKNKKSSALSENTPEPSEQNINTPPNSAASDHSAEHETAAIPTPAVPEKPVEKPVTTPAPKPQSAAPLEKSADKAQPSTAGRNCIVIIGVFKDPQNIAQLQQKLQQNNYTVYEAPSKNGRQIGARFNYTSLNEIQDNLNKLEKLTGVHELWIKQK